MLQKLHKLQISRLGFKPIAKLAFLLLIVSSCTASRWQAEKNQIDKQAGVILQTDYSVTLEGISQKNTNPIISFDVIQVNKTKYPKKLATRRYIQSYRPRWTWLFLGLGSAGMMFYLGNFVNYGDNSTNQTNTYIYNSLATATTIVSLYNQKPVGEKKATDEVRLLTKTGEIVRNDTIYSSNSFADSAIVNMYYKNQLWIRNQKFPIVKGKLEFAVFDHIRATIVDDSDLEDVLIEIGYNNQFFEIELELKDFMQKYVQTSEMIFVMSKPNTSRPNQLTKLNAKAIVPFVDDELGEWYEVRYGAANAFLDKSKSNVIWSKPQLDIDTYVDKSGANQISELNIEIDIPLESRRPNNPYALLILNDTDKTNLYDSRALKAYLNQTFGYENDEIEILNSPSKESMLQKFQQIRDSGPYGELFIYYVGDISFQDSWSLSFSKDSTISYLTLNDWLDEVNNSRALQYRVLFDSKWDVSTRPDQFNELTFEEDVTLLVNKKLQNFDRSFIWFSSSYNQDAAKFKSDEDLITTDYSNFMYHFLLGIKQGKLDTVELKEFMDQEMNFTSRKYYNSAQQTLLFQNKPIDLLK